MKEIRILLIGRKGHGKSSVGNTLLGRAAFPVSSRSQSCTITCNAKETIRDNVRVVVVDTTGIFDTHITTPMIKKELIKTVLNTDPGFHVIAFVLKPVRFTSLMQETQQLFVECFGGNVRRYACLICTECSSEADVRRYIQHPHPSLQALIEACGGLVLPFDNTAATDIKEKQVRHFLQHATLIQSRNGGQCLSNLTFNIGKAYTQNKDLDNIGNESNESKVLFKNTKASFIRDSVQGIGCINKKEASIAGNLNIIYDDHSMPTETTGASTLQIPVLNSAVENEVLPETIVAPTAAKQMKRSTRAGRVFVNDSENIAPIAAKQIKRSKWDGKVFENDSESDAPIAAKQIKRSTSYSIVFENDSESDAPIAAKQIKRSTSYGRVFANDSESDAPIAAKQIKCSTSYVGEFEHGSDSDESSYVVSVSLSGIIVLSVAVILMYFLY